MSILHRYKDYGASKIMGHEFDVLGSRDVIGHVTIRLPGVDFLSVVHGDHASIWVKKEEGGSLRKVGRTDGRTDEHSSDFYSVQCYALHWTDNEFTYRYQNND